MAGMRSSAAPFLVQAGARLVSQTPAPDSGPLSVMNEAYAGFRAESLGKRTYAVTYAVSRAA
jgi:hypothetical protein